MNKICFISPFTEDAVNTLKILALYFDEIKIMEDVLYSVEPEDKSKQLFGPGDIGIITGVTEFIDDEFKAGVKPLLDANILKVKEEDFIEQTIGEEEIQEITNNVRRLISQKPDLIIDESNIKTGKTGRKISSSFRFSDDEARKVHEKYIGELQVGSTVNMGFVYEYYASLLRDLFVTFSSGNVAVSNSPVLTTLVNYAYNNKSFEEFKNFLQRADKLAPQIAFNILKLSLFDVSRFTFDDVLEIKYQLRNELERFRTELGVITHNVISEYNEQHLLNNLDEVVKYRIFPSVRELEDKIKYSKTRLLLRLSEAIKNPVSYVPFIGTVFHMIPAQLAFFLSLGLVTAETALNYVMEHKQLTNNGLYYLVQLKKKTKR